MTWRDSAACRDMPDDTFYPLGTKGQYPVAQVARAKAVCARCPVNASCLADALERRDPWGIFGGTTAEERATLLRRARKPRLPLVRYVREPA